MKKALKLTYFKKSKKFLDKHKEVLSESEVALNVNSVGHPKTILRLFLN